MESFRGAKYHTGNWPHERVDFTGKRVAVIGTGSSAIQSIPIIAQQAAQLFVFQRTPNYSIPAHNGPVPAEVEQRVRANYKAFRAEVLFARAEFAEALRLLEQAAPELPDDEAVQRNLALYRATAEATEGFTVAKRGDVEIRYLPGTDLVLIDEAFEALQAAHDRIGPLLGGAPPGGDARWP